MVTKQDMPFGAPPELAWIPLTKLAIDPTYQRDMKSHTSRRLVKKIAAEFDWALFQVVTVARDGDRYKIIDGQHRAEGADRVGIEAIPCVVVTDADRARQAQLFVSLNTQRVALTSLAVYHARLNAGEEVALTVQRACVAADVEICRYPLQASSMKPGQTLAASTITVCIGEHGEATTAIALGMVRRTWGEPPGEIRALRIRAVAAAIASGIPAEKADIIVNPYSAGGIEHEAVRLRRDHGGATWRHMAAVIIGRAGGEKPKRRPVPGQRFKLRTAGDPERVNGLPPGHAALSEARTLFPTTVAEPAAVDRVLVSGANNRKLGDRIVKGPWDGMPIYHLTLEERATCPESCFHWASCYGNEMQWARRHRHGDDLLSRLDGELGGFNRKFPQGFVVRLHTLGDFYSTAYVERWLSWLEKYGALHVFGYTAHPRDSDIGKLIWAATDRAWDRFAIRFSSATSGPQGATTIFRKADGPTVDEGILCPADTERTECCGSCGLCWHPSAKDKTIVFLAHGKWFDHEKAAAAALPAQPALDEPAGPEVRARAPKFPVSKYGKRILTPPVVAEVREGPPAQLPRVVRRQCECRRVFDTRDPGETRCEACRRALAAVGVTG